MDRRSFMVGSIAAVLAPNPSLAQASLAKIAARVTQVEDAMDRRRSIGSAVPGTWLASKLGEQFSTRERRIAAFRTVQNIPYKLTAWKGDPDSLFNLGRGDCRHKSAGLLGILRAWKIEARAVQVPFDWADLPIPTKVLEPLLETRGIHDSVEAKIDGRFVLVDATWDSALASVGFPVMTDWDGASPTPAITANATTIVRPGDLKPGADIFAKFGIKWPQRDRTLAFNRAFNAWTDEVRLRSQVARR